MLSDLDATLDRPLARAERGRPNPLWSQLKARLIEMIVSGRLEPHTRLPSEPELCARFGVSRTVVREALNHLVLERRVYKIQGKGPFVADARGEQNFVGSTVSFGGDLVGRAHSVGRQTRDLGIRGANASEARRLRIAIDDPVFFLERVLLVDDEPRTIVNAVIPAGMVPGSQSIGWEGRALYETLRLRYGIILNRAERWIEAALADEAGADLLGIAPGAPVLKIESVSFSGGNVATEYYTALHRTDRDRLHFVID